ncbi:hypothetical protein HYZ80_01505 [Candidatus Parcubacteria bacterium]|nr:hypothetical protein [Candidatus Parcubacteria bacterium]
MWQANGTKKPNAETRSAPRVSPRGALANPSHDCLTHGQLEHGVTIVPARHAVLIVPEVTVLLDLRDEVVDLGP